jgi:hypothetical protein
LPPQRWPQTKALSPAALAAAAASAAAARAAQAAAAAEAAAASLDRRTPAPSAVRLKILELCARSHAAELLEQQSPGARRTRRTARGLRATLAAAAAATGDGLSEEPAGDALEEAQLVALGVMLPRKSLAERFEEELRRMAAHREDARLVQCQLGALEFVRARAEAASAAALPALRLRVERLGRSAGELENALAFVRDDAPVIVHVHVPRVLQLLLADDHYRSQFETGTSSGTLSNATRAQWEERLFGPSYNACAAFDRVKYGVLNTTGSISGVDCAAGYGDSYLLLKSHVRHRMTFTEQDSSSALQVGTSAHYAHVLAAYTDAELADILDVGGGRARSGMHRSAMNTKTYKEAQVHGPLCLSEDVEALVLHPRHAADAAAQALAAQFAKAFGTNVVQLDGDMGLSACV